MLTTEYDVDIFDANFSYNGSGLISGTVVSDSNANGVKDVGEGGFPNVQVDLLDEFFAPLLSATTAADGTYQFTGLEAGTYHVVIDVPSLPAGANATFDPEGPLDGSGQVVLSVGQQLTEVDFGYEANGSVFGGIFQDANGDGVPEGAETSILGVSLDLYDDQGTLLSSATVNNDGNYEFTGLEPGSYSVQVDTSTLPTGYVPTYDYDGVVTPHVADFTVVSGEVTYGVNFGYTGPGSLSGRVFTDLNGDGFYTDLIDNGIFAVRVLLLDDQSSQVDEQNTDDFGLFFFDGLAAGDYTIQVDETTLPPNYTAVLDNDGSSSPHVTTATVVGSQSIDTIFFAYEGPGEAYGTVVLDADLDATPSPGDIGLQGVRVILQDDQGQTQGEDLTDETGGWYFSDLLPGDYTVYVDESTLPPNLTQVWDDDGLQTPHLAAFTVEAGKSAGEITFGYQGPGEVYGTVVQDADLDGGPSPGDIGFQYVRVILQDDQGQTVGEDLTDDTGAWYFSDLLPGDYTVYIDESTLPPNLTQAWDYDGLETPHAASFSVQAGLTSGEITFGYQGPGEVYGSVFHDADLDSTPSPGDIGLQGIRVILQDDQGMTQGEVLTDEFGGWYFSDLLPGDYLVYLDESTLPPNFTQVWDYDGLETPHAAAFTVQAGQATGDVTFGYQGPGEVYGSVFHDADLDSTPSPGDIGLQGVRVILQDDQGMTQGEVLTDMYGGWYFSDLLPGDYLVYLDESTLPPNFTQVWDYDGVETPHAAAFTVQAGQATGDVTFGYQGPGEVYGSVFHDADLDSTPSPGDIGLQGIRVILQDNQGMTQGEVLTDMYGGWYFSDLLPGDYLVYLDESTLPPNFTQVWDYDGVETPHAAAFTVQAGQATGDVTFGYQGPGEVYGTVLHDADLDAVPSGGDIGLQGVRVILQDAQGMTQGEVLTDEFGGWYFSDLLPGDYLVYLDESTLPPNFTQVWDYDGVETPHATAFTVQAGQATGDVWFGYQGPGEVYGSVRHDADLDSLPSPGDIGLQGVRVILQDAQGMTQGEMLTDSNGNWYFSDLLPGDYTVYLDESTLPPNFTQVWDYDGVETPHTASFTVQAGQATGDVWFGYQGPGEVYGQVFDDLDGDNLPSAGDVGLQSVRVTLLDNSGVSQGEVLTDSNGNWYFSDLLPGDYSAVVDPSTLPPNYTPVYDLDGTVTPHVAGFSVQAGEASYGIDFGYVGPGSISGRAVEDADLDGLPSPGDVGMASLPVQLRDNVGVLLTQTTTDGNGNFSFEGLSAGDYVVVIDTSALPAGYTWIFDTDGTITPNAIATTVNAGQSTDGLTFGYVGPGSADGQVMQDVDLDNLPSAADTPMQNVRVQLLDDQGTAVAETLTDSLGKFHFAGLLGGDYTVVVDPSTLPTAYTLAYDSDGTITANEVAFSVTAGVQTYGLSFGYTGPASLAGGVYDDLNGNGVLDAGEPGWRGVRLVLLDDQGMQLQETFTSGFGTYAFMTLLPGDYTVQVDMSTLPSDYVPTFDPDLTMTPNEAALSLGAGVATGNFDFGYTQGGDPDLLAHWTLDEASGGLAMDVTGNGHDGLWSGGPMPVAGLFANGLDFDGQDDVVEVPASTSLDSLSAITMSAWVRLDATGNWLSIVDKRDGGSDGFDLYINESANAFIRINDSTLSGVAVLTTGTWYHVVGTYDGNTMALYVDGVQDASRVIGATTLDTTAPLLLGENYARGNSYFDGVLDDVRLYSRSLDAAEVAALTQEAATVTDTVAPTLGNAAPFGTLAVGTTDVDLSLTTGEDATCRYSETAGVTYDSMSGSFDGVAATSHNAALSGLAAGSYSYYVRCEDVVGNQNTGDFEIAFSIAAPGDLASGLVGHWAFEEGSGTLAVDSSGLGYDGTLLGAPTWTAGQSGQGLAFDGVDDAVSFGAAPALDSMAQVTLSAWVQHSASGGWRSIIDKRDVGNDGYDLYITGGSRLFMRINDQTLTGNTVIADGSWHHVVGVYDGNEMVLYVDGVPDGSRTIGAKHLETWRTLRIGENWELGNSFFGGSMDEVRIYDRALNASEVVELYQVDF